MKNSQCVYFLFECVCLSVCRCVCKLSHGKNTKYFFTTGEYWKLQRTTQTQWKNYIQRHNKFHLILFCFVTRIRIWVYRIIEHCLSQTWMETATAAHELYFTKINSFDKYIIYRHSRQTTASAARQSQVTQQQQRTRNGREEGGIAFDITIFCEGGKLWMILVCDLWEKSQDFFCFVWFFNFLIQSASGKKIREDKDRLADIIDPIMHV